jgi:hypothetical protein
MRTALDGEEQNFKDYLTTGTSKATTKGADVLSVTTHSYEWNGCHILH